jgi:hypothetical protein
MRILFIILLFNFCFSEIRPVEHPIIKRIEKRERRKKIVKHIFLSILGVSLNSYAIASTVRYIKWRRIK